MNIIIDHIRNRLGGRYGLSIDEYKHAYETTWLRIYGLERIGSLNSIVTVVMFESVVRVYSEGADSWIFALDLAEPGADLDDVVFKVVEWLEL